MFDERRWLNNLMPLTIAKLQNTVTSVYLKKKKQ